jgi:hypothetical protein
LAAEKAGVPAVSLIAEGFRGQTEALEPMYGLIRARKAFYPGVVMNDPEDELRGKVASAVVPQIISELTLPLELIPIKPPESPERVVVSGALDDILEEFHARGWTDGMPVVPPTVDKVQDFLSYTDGDPHDIVGVMPPADHAATLWNIAVNGVMAGCKPEYMPVLVAIIEAVSAPEFRVRDGGATPGWEPLVILSGPLADQLGFNSGPGVLRVGNRANTSVGRFLRMYMRNVSGLRAGGTDKATFAYTFNCVLAENDAAVQALGWPPHRVERGFGLEDTVVTVMSAVALSTPVLSTGDANQQLNQIGESYRDATRYWFSRTGLFFGQWHPLIVMTPSVATVIAEASISKQDIARFIQQGIFTADGERLAIRASESERVMSDGLSRPIRIADLVESGILPATFMASDDPNRQLPLLVNADWLQIVVSGDPFRNQSKIFTQNHQHGPPTTRLVRVPEKLRKA